MGMALSKENTSGQDTESVIPSSKLHGRQASIRQSTIKPKAKQPMPDPNELERRFTKVLVSLLVSNSSCINVTIRKLVFCFDCIESTNLPSKEVVSYFILFKSKYFFEFKGVTALKLFK